MQLVFRHTPVGLNKWQDDEPNRQVLRSTSTTTDASNTQQHADASPTPSRGCFIPWCQPIPHVNLDNVSQRKIVFWQQWIFCFGTWRTDKARTFKQTQ